MILARSKAMRSAAITGAVLLIIVATAQLIAQRQGVSLPAPFQETDISVPGHEAVTGIVDFASGATTGRHLHGGEMVGYLVSGSVVLEQDGVAPRVLNAGDSFIIPARIIHTHTNRGQSAARMFITYIIDKGKAVTTPIR
jgi:quercetin dioxygenase-like cupin family protein